MAHHKAAYKSIRKDKKRTVRNKASISELRTTIKKFETLLEAKSAEAKSMLPAVIAKISKAASKGLLHKNNARRKISRLTKRLARVIPAA